MQASASTPLRREDTTAVHSLNRFVFSVPDLDQAAKFYDAFRARCPAHRGAARPPHVRSSASLGVGLSRRRVRNESEYLSFAAYAEDLDALTSCGSIAAALTGHDPHRLADDTRDSGFAIRMEQRCRSSRPTRYRRRARRLDVAAGATSRERRRARKVPRRPPCAQRRLSQRPALQPDVLRSVRLLLRRRSACACPIIRATSSRSCTARTRATITCSRSRNPTAQACTIRVGTSRAIDDVGIGMQQMIDRGYPDGWGVGRHVHRLQLFPLRARPVGQLRRVFVRHRLHTRRRRLAGAATTRSRIRSTSGYRRCLTISSSITKPRPDGRKLAQRARRITEEEVAHGHRSPRRRTPGRNGRIACAWLFAVARRDVRRAGPHRQHAGADRDRSRRPASSTRSSARSTSSS